LQIRDKLQKDCGDKSSKEDILKTFVSGYSAPIGIPLVF